MGVQNDPERWAGVGYAPPSSLKPVGQPPLLLRQPSSSSCAVAPMGAPQVVALLDSWCGPRAP